MTRAVRSCLGVPQLAPWMQSPTAAAERAGAKGIGEDVPASTAASARLTTSSRISGFSICVPALPKSIRLTTVSKDGFDQPKGLESFSLAVLDQTRVPLIPRLGTQESSKGLSKPQNAPYDG